MNKSSLVKKQIEIYPIGKELFSIDGGKMRKGNIRGVEVKMGYPIAGIELKKDEFDVVYSMQSGDEIYYAHHGDCGETKDFLLDKVNNL